MTDKHAKKSDCDRNNGDRGNDENSQSAIWHAFILVVVINSRHNLKIIYLSFLALKIIQILLLLKFDNILSK